MKKPFKKTVAKKTVAKKTVAKKTLKNHPFKVGEKYFFRLVTHYLTGRVKEIYGNFIELEDSAWIADTGRFSDALKSGEFLEIEPIFNTHGINMQTIVDYHVWGHELPRLQK